MGNESTKGRGSRLPAVGNCGKVNTGEEAHGIRFVCRFLWFHVWASESLELSPGKNIVLSLVRKRKDRIFLHFVAS